MNYGNVEIISRGNGNRVKVRSFLLKKNFWKNEFCNIFSENLLMGGLILGEKSAFNQELRTSFVDTGTIHIVALSGYNVTIIAEWLMKLFKFCPKISVSGWGSLRFYFLF